MTSPKPCVLVRRFSIAVAVVAMLACFAMPSTWSETQPAPPPPHIFFTDLISGPAVGGQNGQGAFVTIYGAGFGQNRLASSVSIGKGSAAAYPVWTDTRITAQIGARASSGNIVVHVAGSADTNGVPFTVRAGRIYFVAVRGKDTAAGSYVSPWKTLVHAKSRLRPGDIAYAMNGVQQSSLDAYDSSFSIQTSGRPGAPLALVAYPGATVTLGSIQGPAMAARTPNIDRASDHWVLAGLTFRGAQEGLDLTASRDWRIIGNDFSCPNGFGPTGCIETSQANNIEFLGNTVHDIAKPRTTKTYHAVYFSTDSNHIDVGWNTIARVRGCRGLQFHSSPIDKGTGRNQYDLHVHDNVIHDTVCDGINFATVDPSRGVVEAYNNLIYNTGSGPDPQDGEANYSCIYIQGGAEYGAAGSGTIDIYNNTLYNCGGRNNTDSGALATSAGSPRQFVRLRNNIIVQRPGEAYLSPNSSGVQLTGENNIFWGSPEALPPLRRKLQNVLDRDPLLVNPAGAEFTLQQGSPALDAGTPTSLQYDIRGLPRPTNGRPDLGAYQREDGTLTGHTAAGTIAMRSR